MKKGISGKIADPVDTGRKLNVLKTFFIYLFIHFIYRRYTVLVTYTN